jgi:hypothetical protein
VPDIDWLSSKKLDPDDNDLLPRLKARTLHDLIRSIIPVRSATSFSRKCLRALLSGPTLLWRNAQEDGG